MKRDQHGLTIIELLTVLAIIVILISLLLPAYEKVKHAALDAKQRAQFAAIGLGLEAFRADFGSYPASNATVQGGALAGEPSYTGAQKLAEAMVGRHLLGYHASSNLATTDGIDAGLIPPQPYPLPSTLTAAEFQLYRQNTQDYYVDVDTANAFRIGNVSVGTGPDLPGLFENVYGSLAPNTHVLCDVYTKQSLNMPGNIVVKAGAPILYYRANTTNKSLRGAPNAFAGNTYNALDNDYLVRQRAVYMDAASGGTATIRPFGGNWDLFYGNSIVGDPDQIGYIQDPTVTSAPTSYRPDSFILISAGKDGIYGTADDITNFGN